MSQIVIGKYTVDPVMLDKGFARNCGPFACESNCCTGGVWIDPVERDRILEHKDAIRFFMDETQITDDSRWFETYDTADADFPSGRAVGTEIHNGKCVFLQNSGRCSLQVCGAESGLGRWALKPFYCIAFPITVAGGTVTFDDYLQERSQCCSIAENHSAPLIDSCQAELEFVLGREGYRQLRNHKDPVHHAETIELKIEQ